MLKQTVLSLLAALAVAAAWSMAALAQPNQPYDKPVTPTAAQPLPNHGIKPTIRLNAVIQDGQPAAFTATVLNTASVPIRFLSATVVWSFSGLVGHRRYAELSGLSTPKGSDVDYVDLDRLWVKLGTLFKSSSIQLAGKITIPDRTQWGTTALHAQFLCVQLVVQGATPGEPNAGWKAESPTSCSQYSVSQ